MKDRYRGLIEAYRDRLPVPDGSRVVSLGEGDTPLIRLNAVGSDAARGIDVYVKCEGLNPTGSFKDRGMTVAVTRAVNEGSRAVICASTGNTSAAAAAYAARAGIDAFVVIPEGRIALGKLAQAMMHGAKVIQILGNFDAGMEIVKSMPAAAPVTLVNSVNPYRLQGQKTAAFEVVDALGFAPDFHFLPLGNAGNISAYWMGYREYHENGPAARTPKLVGCQASGAAPFLRGAPIDDPETVATAIRIGRPQSWALAMDAVESSRGWFQESPDERILATQKLLAEREGVFCEPASAVSVAGALLAVERGDVPDGAVVVCTLTGHGLKDPDVAISQCSKPLSVEATPQAVKAAILGAG